MKNKKPVVSIVIVNYNGKDLLKIILKSIKKINFNHNYEVFVVDNKSMDGSQELIKKIYPKIKLIQNKENLGYSGINSALKYCKGEYILFLNNDMEIDKNCISRLVETIKSDKNIAMAAPRLVNFYDKKSKSNGTWLSRSFYNGHIGNGKNIIREIPYLGVGLIRKDFTDMFGYLFDPDYFIYAEDVDLGLRIRLNGKKILFNPQAVLYHMHALTSQKTSKAFTTFLMERNSLTTFFKIFSSRNVILFFPYVFGMRLLAIIKDIFTLNFSSAFMRFKAIAWVIFNIGTIYKKRKEVQRFRKVGDSYILKVFTEKYLLKKKFII
jgi:GT2 family glycosyltransferase